MHIVGSAGSCVSQVGGGPCVTGTTPGHPERIRATFEHVGNTPLASYNYHTLHGNKVMPADTSGSWLFLTRNSQGPFNCMLMREQNGNIIPATTTPPCPAGSFNPSDTRREQPFAAELGVFPNPIDGSDTNSNTEIITINNSVRGMMPTGDVRDNYYAAGATWTIFGAPPAGSNEVGTRSLAGSTTETYDQPGNCFGCHSSVASSLGLATTDVSHIFDVIQSLNFPGLVVRTTANEGSVTEHRIVVTVTNSASGAPVSGATVRVFEPNGAGLIASGTTSSAGIATLSYSGCFEIIQPVGGILHPIFFLATARFPPPTFPQ
jgi:hypothetical protein